MKVPTSSFNLEAIGYVSSCFGDKFGIPRQPSLVPSSRACVELVPPYANPEAVRGLEHCSHVWLQFIFHKNSHSRWKARVRPPRLGGNKRLGVFASRSPMRPNALGLSAAKLEKIETKSGVKLHISGHDLLNGTPIIDIKPYVPYADCLEAASNNFARHAPHLFAVSIDDRCEQVLASEKAKAHALRELIIETLAQDPRPAYQKNTGERVYATELYDWNIQWRYEVRDNVTNGSSEFVRVTAIREV